jgi:hypothetical protein
MVLVVSAELEYSTCIVIEIVQAILDGRIFVESAQVEGRVGRTEVDPCLPDRMSVVRRRPDASPTKRTFSSHPDSSSR